VFYYELHTAVQDAIPGDMSVRSHLHNDTHVVSMAGIFLSHSRKDKQFVLWLGERLQGYGADVWIDLVEIGVGDPLTSTIAAGIEKTGCLGLVLSPDSVDSEWVKREVQLATSLSSRGKEIRILPIVARPCKIPRFLKDRAYADFQHKRNWEESVQWIVRTLGLDDKESKRIRGNRMIPVGDFVQAIKKHFGERQVEVKFLDDWSGIAHIRVQEENGLLEWYNSSTMPTHLDLVRDIFAEIGLKRIKEVLIQAEFNVTAEEQIRYQDELRSKYGLPEDSYAAQWKLEMNENIGFSRAWEDWSKWLDGKRLIALVLD
jgi:hypothetical protein